MKLGKATLFLDGKAVATEIELEALTIPELESMPPEPPRKPVLARTEAVVFFSAPTHETKSFVERLFLATSPPWGSA